MVVMVSGNLLAFYAFAAIAVFCVLAVVSMRRHLRTSRRPWAGEQDGAVHTDEPTSTRR